MDNFKIDIKNDSLFKNIFLRDIGRKYMCSIISELLNLDYDDLIKNIRFYSSEHPRINIKNKSSYSDIIYEYRNKIIIIEMNYVFSKKLINKNYFYLLFRHIFDATNENNYNQNKETYLIDIDNFDIVDKMNLNMKNKFIYESLFQIKDENLSLYKNIKTYRINLDYLSKRKYNYNRLTNIERDCLIFIERNKNKLRDYIKNKHVEGVIRLLEVVEIDGKFFPLYDKEEWDRKVWEDALQHEKMLVRKSAYKEGKTAGMEAEMEVGLEQGIEQGVHKIAKNLKNNNFSIEEIMKLTGLTKEQIKFL